jgi:hypothetical protein
MTRYRLASALLLSMTLAIAGFTGAGQEASVSRRDADSLMKKLFAINQNAERRAIPIRATKVTERELNSYLRIHAQEDLPAGVMEPYVWIVGEGRVSGRALVDLDEVRKQKPRGWLDPAGYLTGRVPVRATGVLITRDGVGRFTLETAEVAGITIPTWMLQEIVTHYSRNPHLPDGFSMDAPFELPARIREVRVGRGEAVIIQ